MWMSFSMEDLYALPLNIFEFYENGRMKVMVYLGYFSNALGKTEHMECPQMFKEWLWLL